ncbi:MAG: AarF/UbiB family protein [Planctomycetota bacterium]
MALTSVPQRIRSLPRLPQIVRVLIKYGFGDVTSRIGVDSLVHKLKSRVLNADPRFNALTTEQRIKLALEELGPTFVKLGQVMATRPDLIPMSLITELRELQDKVKPFDTAGIEDMIEAELGRPVSEVFAHFETEPLAAASIAQVHRATLKDGRKVVLKIQRPNLERVIETDLVLLTWLAELAEERLPELRRYRPVGLVDEFHRSVIKEIDFEIEAYHLRRYAKNFQGDPDIYVPAVVEELSTSRILCEEFVDGIKLNDPKIHELGLDLVRIAKNGIRLAVTQVFEHGFFHADPHPGNLFVVERTKLCVIDFGMMGSLDRDRIDELLSFLVGILTHDLDRLIRLFYRLDLIDEDVDVRALRRDVDDIIHRFQSMELANINLGAFLQQVFDVISRHDVQVPADLLLVGKALATIEGVGRELYPELNAVEEFRPLILKVFLQRLTDPSFFSRTPRRILADAAHLAETAPRDLRLILRRLRNDGVNVNVSVGQLEALSRAHAQGQNRIAVGVVIAAMILAGGYLLLHTDLSPWIGSFPLAGILALGWLVGAGLLGLVLSSARCARGV